MDRDTVNSFRETRRALCEPSVGQACMLALAERAATHLLGLSLGSRGGSLRDRWRVRVISNRHSQRVPPVPAAVTAALTT